MKRGPGRVGSPLGALGLVRAVRPRHVMPDPRFRFLRQQLPRNPAAQHEEDAGETGAVRDARPPPFGRGGGTGRSGSMKRNGGIDAFRLGAVMSTFYGRRSAA